VVGYGETAMYLGSDALALAPLTQRISYLQEDDWVMIRNDGVTIFDTTDTPVQREIVLSGLTGAMIGKGHHRHYMQKEIYEQPTVLGDTLQAFLHPADNTVRLPAMPFALHDFDDVSIIACGTSFHAGVVAKYWFEEVAGLRTRVDIASEYRYRPFVESARTLCVFVSQSGETADTLAALRYTKENGQKTLAIVNVPSSTMAREADSVLVTLAGPEIGVASTKAFTTQLLVLAVLAIRFAVERQKTSAADAALFTDALLKLPEQCSTVLKLNNDFLAIAQEMLHARDVLFIGRGSQYPIALEGALKLKELSYIHAEGLAAGELKHGSIALIDEAVPIVALAPKDALFEKTASNIQEIIARKGKVILLSDKAGLDAFAAEGSNLFASIELPPVHHFTAPIVYTLPVQFLAYHIAVLKGTDVDQPRNLAKSVTVE
jgi:glucosamine--fructose-6-phosphate aminotransferase (isomerizing)